MLGGGLGAEPAIRPSSSRREAAHGRLNWPPRWPCGLRRLLFTEGCTRPACCTALSSSYLPFLFGFFPLFVYFSSVFFGSDSLH